MGSDIVFTDEEIAIDEALGYPKAFAKLCRDRSFSPYSHGPPFTFTPYALPQLQVHKEQELDELFPIIDLKAKPTTKPKIFVSLLWKQLNHLGNAGFDPEIFRVDPYGNVLYYHADAASPLAWDVDHWFPCSMAGNLRILQWQVCKKKHNKLEILIPWWDLQVGVSINQFLSIFASSNSDFRRRAFSWLFSDGENEELNACQTVDSHAFPQHFIESRQKTGLAPAAVVLSRRESCDASSSALRSLDMNRKPRSSTPIIAARKVKPGLKENEDPGMVSNPYQAIVIARDSLRQREETAKVQAEIQKLDVEVDELRQQTEDEKVTIQDLELVLIKRRRKAEKCRHLAEAQSSYRTMLEKMIRDAMHQSVVYKEQVRLNQAAANALKATLEAQKAICDSSERELHKKFKQRDELEKQIKPNLKQARKRSRVDDSLAEEADHKMVLYVPGGKPKGRMHMEMSGALLEENALYLQGSNVTSHKELRKFLEEEQKASEAAFKKDEEIQELEEENKETIPSTSIAKPGDSRNGITTVADDKVIDRKFNALDIGENVMICDTIRFPAHDKPEDEEDEESRKQRGKGNVEKWLQMLLEENAEVHDASLNPQNGDPNEANREDEIIRKLDLVYPQKEAKISKARELQDLEVANQLDSQQLIPMTGGDKREKEIAQMAARKPFSNNVEKQSLKEEIFELKCRDTPVKNPPYRITSEKNNPDHQVGYCTKGVENQGNIHLGNEKKEKELVRSESARTFRRIPSSPSLILSGMKKRVDCLRKKPLVMGDEADGDENYIRENNILKSTIKTIKRAVKI